MFSHMASFLKSSSLDTRVSPTKTGKSMQVSVQVKTLKALIINFPDISRMTQNSMFSIKLLYVSSVTIFANWHKPFKS